MGYTHYFLRTQVRLNEQRFAQAVQDCYTLYRRAEIPLANWDGRGKPVFRRTVVAFNGIEQCGHTVRDLGIAWPAPQARGGVHIPSQPVAAWVAGMMLNQRTCGGDCSHETFRIEQTYRFQGWEDRTTRPIFACCKTAYKPYDLVVTGCLVVFKHLFSQHFIVRSDGTSHDWENARRLCQHVLGYGQTFQLDDN